MQENFYFDNAATTFPKPEAVYRAMDECNRGFCVNPGRSGYELATKAAHTISRARKLLAEFFNCPGGEERLVFAQNATDALNIALHGLVEDGDHIVSTRLEHNAVLRPLNHLERDRGCTITWVGRDKDGFVDPQAIRDAITAKTRVVVINHGSNVLGTIQDLDAIGAAVAESDAKLVVDSCQTAGVLPIDVEASRVDVLTFTGHKGLFGPMGTGGLWVREDVCIKPCKMGGTGVDSITPYQPDDYPWHLETGTPALPNIAGLLAAQEFFAELGRDGSENGANLSHFEACCRAMHKIHEHEMKLVEKLLEGISGVEAIDVYGPRSVENRVATLSLNVRGVPADQLGAILDADYHINVRTGLHCAPKVHEDEGTVEQKGTVRFAPGYYTTEAEVEHAIQALREIAEDWAE